MQGLTMIETGWLLRGVGSGIITKAFSLGLTMAVVPLTLNHLRPERYGLWGDHFLDAGVARPHGSGNCQRAHANSFCSVWTAARGPCAWVYVRQLFGALS